MFTCAQTKKPYKWMGGWMEGWMDRWTDRWMHGFTAGRQAQRQTRLKKEKFVCILIFFYQQVAGHNLTMKTGHAIGVRELDIIQCDSCDNWFDW